MSWTFTTLVRNLNSIGVKRAVVQEDDADFSLVIFYVAGKHKAAVTRLVADSQPMAYSFTVRTLPWWKCWFSRYQFYARGCEVCGFRFPHFGKRGCR